MRLNEEKLNKIIKESIEDFLRNKSVGSFTPYSPEEAENNKRAIGHVGNPSYGRAKKADTSAKNTSNPPSYWEWKNKFKDMSYSEYSKKRIDGEI